MRKMATLRRIDEIKPIPDADLIELVIMDGWQSIVLKAENFKVGDFVFYLEVDSWVPHTLAPFLTSNPDKIKSFNDVPGNRLKTAKKRGELSQGLIIPLHKALDFDFSSALGVQKWEPKEDARLSGNPRGNFPAQVPKTDQERIQNRKRQFMDDYRQQVYEKTEKLHGTSGTFYLDADGDFHVCSRNNDLTRDEKNVYWQVAIKYDIEQKLRDAELLDYAIQGEICGPGINGNDYGLKDYQFFVFDVSHKGKKILPEARQRIVKALSLTHVPIISKEYRFPDDATVESVLLEADNKPSAINGCPIEGYVYKRLDVNEHSFKVVSNEWLLAHKS